MSDNLECMYNQALKRGLRMQLSADELLSLHPLHVDDSGSGKQLSPAQSGPLAVTESWLSNNQAPKMSESSQNAIDLTKRDQKPSMQMWATIRILSENAPPGKVTPFSRCSAPAHTFVCVVSVLCCRILQEAIVVCCCTCNIVCCSCL